MCIKEMYCNVPLTDPIGVNSGEFGTGTANTSMPILLRDVNCTGQESTITDCTHRSSKLEFCMHSDDAGVVCQGKCIPAVLNYWCTHRLDRTQLIMGSLTKLGSCESRVRGWRHPTRVSRTECRSSGSSVLHWDMGSGLW